MKHFVCYIIFMMTAISMFSSNENIFFLKLVAFVFVIHIASYMYIIAYI